MGMGRRAGKAFGRAKARGRLPRHKVSFDLATEDLMHFRALCKARGTDVAWEIGAMVTAALAHSHSAVGDGGGAFGSDGAGRSASRGTWAWNE